MLVRKVRRRRATTSVNTRVVPRSLAACSLLRMSVTLTDFYLTPSMSDTEILWLPVGEMVANGGGVVMASYIPSPSQGVWYLGPVPIRAYALCIIAGILVAVFWTRRRWQAKGGNPDDITDVVMWAVPFGIVGGRLYHVITDPELYFTAGQEPIRALFIWDGGLGIWGAVALGAVGAWIGCRRKGIRLADFADALAPGLVLAQAIGRWGNYFNQELYGPPTTLPWGLWIDPANRPADTPDIALYQPTFLYESLWDLGVVVLLLWAGNGSRSATAGCSRCMSPPTPSGGPGWRRCAWTTRTTSSGSASTIGPR